MQGLSSEDRTVLPGSPAEKAGLLTGDQLIAAEGIEIREVKEIHHALSEKDWGKNITLTLHRGGKKKEITVQLPPSEDQISSLTHPL
jgi:S1-C subfamily serine protease